MAPRSLPLASSAGVRRACAGAGLVALLAGCGGGATGSHGVESGRLYGTVTHGPTTPACHAGMPCSKPADGVQLVFEQGGRTVASVVTATDGSYSISLPVGTYTVATAPQRPAIGRGLEPSTVHVVAGPRQKRDFTIDTGMR